ncbi:hypothetical protein Ciccas_008382 [Cichlidogyrus casuarinus]|uniref:Proline dehydrogenase n=1 Tax=Cichlidogyrus casuarinus TaxID=1844966 RepID=A0ABD2Q1K8_9PLAT
MRKYGVRTILDYSAEKDIQESEAVNIVKQSLAEVVKEPNSRPNSALKEFETSIKFADRSQNVVSARTYFYESEAKCDKNMEIFIDSIDSVVQSSGREGLCAIKLTALGRPQFLLQMSDFIVELQRLFELLISDSKANLPSSIRSLDVHEFRRRLKELGIEINYDEESKWFTLLDHAHSCGVSVMVDAEQTYFQPAIRRLAMEMMRRFNKESPIVFNTYQCYLKSAYSQMTQDMNVASIENFSFGAKLVRGAYIDQERARAKELDYEDPTNPNFEATSRMYEKTLEAGMKEIVRRPEGSVSLMVASHNEDTIRFAIQKMKEFGIGNYTPSMCFAQLYGMCDNLSYALG